MPDGFDVQPEHLHAGAAGLRADASGVVEAGGRASAAAQSAAGSAGEGPLRGAANELAAQLDRAVDAMRRSIESTAAAIDAASSDYQTSDAAASRRISTAAPGF